MRLYGFYYVYYYNALPAENSFFKELGKMSKWGKNCFWLTFER